MRGSRTRPLLTIAAGLLVAASLGTRPAAGQNGALSPQEKQRQEILRELGLKKKAPPETVPPAPAPPDERGDAGAATGETASKPKGGTGTGGNAPALPAAPSFGRAIHPLLMATCKACHSAGAPGGASRLLLSGDAVADHAVVARLADARNPDASALLAKASGAALHGGGAPWPPASAPYQRVMAWIRGGARLDAAARAAAPPAEPAAPRAPVARHPPPTPAPEPTPAPAPAAGAAPPTSPEPPAAATPAKPTFPTFAPGVHQVLMDTCAVCHRPGGPAAMTRLLLSGEAAHDEQVVRGLVDPQAPELSLMVTKAAGEMHGGGPVLPPGDARLGVIVAWARGLAPVPELAAPAGAGATPPAVPGPAVVPAAAAPVPFAAGHGPPAGMPPHGPPGYALPLGFMLNGRFSLDYERRQFTGDPFASSSVNALRSYHHFLFLSHEAPADPCGLSLEVLTLQFWEAHCRVPALPAPFRLSVAGGKIVVPFGADPLYHQNYGGLGGFDQPILPVIWAVEGLAAHLVVTRGAFVLTDDLFVVRGYTLAHADSVINLQNDFSPTDDTRLGWGNRLGAAWMFVSAWYSAYYNPLGFGRRLFMQAFDLTVWRPRGIPVAQHFSLGAGLLRADVSGGGAGVSGPGLDYYDFGSYVQLRYYPTDWLYVQYRQGLRTFNNRRGVIVDNTRLTSADASTHNFAVVARHRGLTVGLYYFINMEKADEVPNDLVRLTGVYEF